MAKYGEAGPGIRGVEQILVSVVSISKTRELVAANDGNTKLFRFISLIRLSLVPPRSVLEDEVSCSFVTAKCSKERK